MAPSLSLPTKHAVFGFVSRRVSRGSTDDDVSSTAGVVQEERSPNTQESFVEIDLGNGENTQDNHSSRWASEKRDFERLFFHGNKIKIRDICVWYFIVLFVMVYMALFFSGYNWFDLSRVTAKIHNLTAVTMEMNETLHQLNGTLKDLIPELREEIVTLLGANNTIEH